MERLNVNKDERIHRTVKKGSVLELSVRDRHCDFQLMVVGLVAID